MLAGAGQLRFETLDLDTGTYAQNLVYDGPILSFSMTTESDEKVARALREGKLEVVESAIGAVTRTVTITQESVDWWGLGFALDEIPAASTAVPWDIWKDNIKVPATAPYEITDAAITAGNAAAIKIVQSADALGRNRRPLKQSTSPPPAGSVHVDGATGKITFNAAQAGATIAYAIPKTWASGETIGLNNTYDLWGAIKFVGKLYIPNMPVGVGFVFWRLTRSSIGDIEISDGVPTLQSTFKAVPAPGRRSPVSLFNLATLAD